MPYRCKDPFFVSTSEKTQCYLAPTTHRDPDTQLEFLNK